MKKSKMFNIAFPVWFLLLYPLKYLMVIPINLVILAIILAGILGVFKIEKKNNMFVKILLKTWAIGIVGYITSSTLIYVSKYISFNDISTNVINNPFDNFYSLAYVSLTLVLTGFMVYKLNMNITFKNLDTVIEKSKIRIITVIITFISIPYIFLVPKAYAEKQYYGIDSAKSGAVKEIFTIENIRSLISDNKQKNIEDENIKEVFINSYKYLNTNFRTEQTDVTVDKTDMTLVANVKIDESLVINDLNEYEYWSKYSSLITLICAKGGDKVVIYLYDKNGNPIQKNIYTRAELETDTKTTLDDLANNPDKLINIIEVANTKT